VITITQLVKQIVDKSPIIREGLAEDLLNLSAVARQIKPEIESKLMFTVSEGAIVMALKRNAQLLQKELSTIPAVAKIKNLTVRSDLVEYAFRASPKMSAIHSQLIDKSQTLNDSFLNFAQGAFEVTIIVSDNLMPMLEKITKHETLLEKFDSLSSISIKLPKNTAATHGAYYPFFRILAIKGISFVEIISTYSELTFVFEEAFIDQAFSLFKSVSAK